MAQQTFLSFSLVFHFFQVFFYFLFQFVPPFLSSMAQLVSPAQYIYIYVYYIYIYIIYMYPLSYLAWHSLFRQRSIRKLFLVNFHNSIYPEIFFGQSSYLKAVIIFTLVIIFSQRSIRKWLFVLFIFVVIFFLFSILASAAFANDCLCCSLVVLSISTTNFFFGRQCQKTITASRQRSCWK